MIDILAKRPTTHKQHLYTSDNLAPHANTQRWSYTVAGGLRYQLQSMILLAVRSAAPTAAGWLTCRMNVNAAGVGNIDFLTLAEQTADVGKPQVLQQAIPFSLKPGDSINVSTIDGSTGGTYYYRLAQWGYEVQI